MERIIIATILLVTGLFLTVHANDDTVRGIGNLLWLVSILTLIVLFITN